MVGWVETLQAQQLLVDDFQLRVEELGLLGIWWYSLQLFDDLLSYPQVLIVDWVQVLVHILEI